MSEEEQLADLIHEARCGPEEWKSSEHIPWTEDHREWDLATARALLMLGVEPTKGKWVTTVSPAEYVELQETVARLRRQNKEYAEKRDQEMRQLRSEVTKFKTRMFRAKELMRGSPVDWTNYHGENDWWRMTSQNNRDIIMAIVAHYEDGE